MLDFDMTFTFSALTSGHRAGPTEGRRLMPGSAEPAPQFLATVEVTLPATIVKPAAPMTLEKVDKLLRRHSVNWASFTAEDRERAMLDVDRLLDVRLAITKATT